MAGGSRGSAAPKLEPIAPGAKVTWLELFYDLVFAFAFIRVTLTGSQGLASVVRAMLLVALLWFLWINFSALANVLRGDEGAMPYAMFVSVGATFVAALVIPYAYDQRADPDDYLFVACYILVRGLQILLLWLRARQDPRVRPGWLALVTPPVLTSVLLLAAAAGPNLAPRRTFAIQATFLGLAVILTYGVSANFVFRELARISVRHWADRYTQIILVALGESIISLGISRFASPTAEPAGPLIATGVLGLTITGMMAVAYFDQRMLAAEQSLREAHGPGQIALARDAYALLHLPMIIGILLFSLGLRETLDTVADPTTPVTVHVHIGTTALLYGGLFLYLAALVGFQLRTGQRVSLFDIVGRPMLILVIPAVTLLPAIAALALLAAFSLAVTGLKLRNEASARTRLRATVRARERAVEAAEEAGAAEWRRDRPVD
ncbi:MAG: low temperature requirement protein A [Micromonosporaceae bacterium]|nr:low temperature requirement protein A [Micromonosporaceae bacterium]